MAVLPEPLVLLESASVPVAVLWEPKVLLASAATPVAVFSLPLVLFKALRSHRRCYCRH